MSFLNHPAPEANWCTTVQLSMDWLTLGSPERMFNFSEEKRTFLDAREACLAQPGKVRLAVLDTLFREVTGWVEEYHRDREYWVDATRPENTGELSLFSCSLCIVLVCNLGLPTWEIWVVI